MARPLKLRLLTRTAAMVLATAVATVGLSSTAAAQAAPVAERPSIAAPGVGIQAGPYSPWPGQGWFWQATFTTRNTCDYYGFLYVLYGYARGSTCALRYDFSGYDLWLRA